jgi:integrase
MSAERDSSSRPSPRIASVPHGGSCRAAATRTDRTLSRQFTKLATKAGLRMIRLHDTRHTAASIMLAAGESPKVVAEILGPSSPTITMNLYQHLMPGMGDAAGERLTD